MSDVIDVSEVRFLTKNPTNIFILNNGERMNNVSCNRFSTFINKANGIPSKSVFVLS